MPKSRTALALASSQDGCPSCAESATSRISSIRCVFYKICPNCVCIINTFKECKWMSGIKLLPTEAFCPVEEEKNWMIFDAARSKLVAKRLEEHDSLGTTNQLFSILLKTIHTIWFMHLCRHSIMAATHGGSGELGKRGSSDCFLPTGRGAVSTDNPNLGWQRRKTGAAFLGFPRGHAICDRRRMPNFQPCCRRFACRGN